jgi:predicted transcriptional regulator
MEMQMRLWKCCKGNRAAFTVADSTLMLALFWPSGPLDIAREWVVTSERAREWGKGLFEYYLSK